MNAFYGLLLFVALAVLVECRPQDVNFPEEAEGPDDDNRQGVGRPPFRPNGQGGRPPFRPNGQGGRPNNGQVGRPNNGQGGLPNNGQGGRPNNGQGGRPNNGQGGLPNNGQGGLPNNGQGGLPNNGQGGRPVTQPPTPNTSFQTQPTQPTPATPTDATTTRIPPRDPTNRIVYLVSCDCPFTYQYSPVCGTDGQTYGNMGVLQCAKTCGTQVDVYLAGACGRNNG